MMTFQKKAWFSLLAGLLVFVTVACSCGSLTDLLNQPQAEAIPGLAGRWRYDVTGFICTVNWDGGRYAVESCIDGDGEVFEIRNSSWSNDTFQWTFYVPSTGYETTLEVTGVSGDELYLDWWGTGGSGELILYRVP